MCNAGAAAGAQLAQGFMSAQNSLHQGKMESNYYNYLADRSEKQAGLIDKAAEQQSTSINEAASRESSKSNEQYKQAESSQKAAMAANGVYADSGTSQDIIEDTNHKRLLDEAAIRLNSENAIKETKLNALNQQSQLYAEMTTNRVAASNARLSSKINAMNSIASSSAQAASTWSARGK